MPEEIQMIFKFKGKAVKTGDWVYGDLCWGMGGPDDPCIMMVYGREYSNNYDEIEVIRETVGQYIGMDDLNNVGMYVGDRITVFGCQEAVIKWDQEHLRFFFDAEDDKDHGGFRRDFQDQYEVTGNIWDTVDDCRSIL